MNMMSHDWFSAGKNKKNKKKMLQIPFFHQEFLRCGLCFRLVLYSKTSSTNCSSSPSQILLSLSFCLHQPLLATVPSSPQLEHWSRTSVSPCGLDASPFPLCFFLCSLSFALISFPHSDQSAAVGSTRGWEIPAEISHCMTMQYTTTELKP